MYRVEQVGDFWVVTDGKQYLDAFGLPSGTPYHFPKETEAGGILYEYQESHVIPDGLKKKKDTNPKHGLGIRKVPIHAVPIPVMSEVGLAMMEGGCKYGTHNYRDMGVRASTYVDAVWRHLFLQWWEGEDIDKDSGLNHVVKAISSLVVLRDSMMMGNWVDDRPLRHPQNHTEALNDKASDIVDRYPNPVPGFYERLKQ